MARSYHSEERILQAVRDLFLERGRRGVTTAAISARSGAPVGSLYHRFGSISEMVAELWIRTALDLGAELAAAADRAGHGMPVATAVIDAIVDFSARRPHDARFVLGSSRREVETDPAAGSLDAATGALARRVAREVYGRATPSAVDRVQIGVFGVTFTAVRQALTAGRDPRRLRGVLHDAAAAVLDVASAGA